MIKKEYTPFQRAILDSVLEDYTKLMADVPKITASPTMVARAKKNERRNHTISVGRRIARAALIGAIIVFLLAASVMAIPALRARVVEFFLRESSDFYGITFDPETAATAPTVIEQEYSVTYLPDNYTEISVSSLPMKIKRVWSNDMGEQLSFIQRLISNVQDNPHMSVDSGENKETVLMRGYLVTIITNAEYRELIWTDNAYCYILEIPTSVPQEEVEKIFASWGPKE